MGYPYYRTGIIFLVAGVLSVYFFGKMLSTLGDALKIDDFNKTATIWYILNYGMILWIPLFYLIIGALIMIVLEVLFIIFLIVGPRKYLLR
jgi:uncharacterized membrane protein